MTDSHTTLAELEADAAAAAAMQLVELAVDHLARAARREGAVSTGCTPAELAARFDEALPRRGRPLAEIVTRLRDQVLSDCNRLAHPRYAGHQVSAPLPAAIWTEAVVAALNQSLAVWEMSPTMTVVEHRLVRWLCDLAGYGVDGGGTLTSGGTEATFTALLAARAAVRPDVWTEGMGERPPVVLHGEHAHYAVARAVGELGIGVRNAVAVPSRGGCMDPVALRSALDGVARDGRAVMAVVATAGSTATGSFDPLENIGALCAERGIWLHVDGAHGASALLSARERHRVRGLHLARSIAWDPHKMMLLPLSAGVLLVRDERDLTAAFTQRAPYLFHGGAGERGWDQGTRSFLCSRRADALKLWVALQRYGADGIGALYERLCDAARAMHALLTDHPAFTPLHEPECNILCFRWIGDGTRSAEELDDVNGTLRERYNRSGAGWITTTVLDGRRVLRVTIMNPRTTVEDVAEIVAGLAREAAAMDAEGAVRSS